MWDNSLLANCKSLVDAFIDVFKVTKSYISTTNGTWKGGCSY